MAFLAPILGGLASSLFGKIMGGEEGMRKVPKTGVYMLHKGEVVIKKKDAKKVPKALKMKQMAKPKPTKVTKSMMKKSMVK